MNAEPLLAYARKLWPQGFTKRELYEALDIRSGITELRRLKAIENTGMRRRRQPVWRYRPYQLHLPLGDK